MDDTEVGNVPPTRNVAKMQQQRGITNEQSKPKAKEDSTSNEESSYNFTLEYISRKLASLKGQRLTTDIAMKIASTVELAPYLPKEMKDKMRHAANDFKMASVEYSSTLEASATATATYEANKTILEENPLARMTVTREELLALLAKEDVLWAKERALWAKEDAFRQLNGFESAFRAMVASLHEAMDTLHQCCRLSQAVCSFSTNEHTSTASDVESHSNDDHDDDDRDDDDSNKDDADEICEIEADHHASNERKVAIYHYTPVRADETKLATKLCTNITPLDHTKYMILPDPNNEFLQHGILKLEKVAKCWSTWIENCHIISGTVSNKHAIAIKDVITEIRETLKNPEASPAQIPPSSHPFASMLSQEVHCTQPVFGGLLQLIGDCCDEYIDSNGYSHGSSQPKTKVMKSHLLPGTNSRQERIVDVSMEKPGRFRIQTDQMEQKLTCQLKPLFRKSISFKDLHEESRHQVLGHLAENVMPGLTLYGCGAKTWATGLTATVAYVIVYRLDLTISEYTKEDPDIAKLKLSESAKLPTMSKDCYDKWAEKFLTEQGKLLKPNKLKQIQKQIVSLREELYENDSYASDSNPIPIGIRVLWHLMLQRRSGLFGPDYQDIIAPPDKQNQLGRLLGTGSFGLVFSYGQDEKSDKVLKVSHFQNCVNIKRERAVLQALKREQGADYTVDDQVALPILIQFTQQLTMKLGGVTGNLNGIVLSPKGTPMLSWLRKTLVDVRTGTFYEKVVGQLEKALIFMHEKGVYHNDVAPKNIIIRSLGDSDWNVWLVDFGCASYPKKRKLTGVVGTLLYAHKYILNRRSNESWAPKPEHDFFSLGLTISVLINAGVTCWDMQHWSTDDTVTTRYTEAHNLIESSDCREEEKEKLLDWISAEIKSAAPEEAKKRPRIAI